ncbi:MAG: hypothetical protein QY326_01125 [Bdellovibrionota bacterium]|nr:MAG: hypothetical protein QY326_01125 [Bdellovibrionota bacterium]
MHGQSARFHTVLRSAGSTIPLSIEEETARRYGDTTVQLGGRWTSHGPEGLVVIPESIVPIEEGVVGLGGASTLRTILVLRVNFRGAAVECSASDLSTMLWRSPENVGEFFEEASYRQIAFDPDADGNGHPDVFSVSIPYATSYHCLPYIWMLLANQAATAQGVVLSRYQHVMYFVPGSATQNCGWTGLAVLRCGADCWAISSACRTIDTTIHELGHNFGMRHAAVDADNDGAADPAAYYSDHSCPMGASGIGWRRFNAPHRDQAGWLPLENQATVSRSGERYISSSDIIPDEIPGGLPSVTQVLKIRVPGVAGSAYFISYRHSDSRYSRNLPVAWDGKTSVHRFDGHRESLFLGAVGDSETIDLGSLQITQVESAPNWARVRIHFGLAPTPTPTQTPLATPTAAPTTTPNAPPRNRFQVVGKVKVPPGQLRLLRQIRVSIRTPEGGLLTRRVRGDGSFTARLRRGSYSARIVMRPGVAAPARLKRGWKRFNVPGTLMISLSALR